MAPSILQVICERIVTWHAEGMSASNIAYLADCSIQTVYYILAYHHDYATTRNPFIHDNHGRSQSLDMGDINYITSLVDAQPNISLDEIQENLIWYRGCNVSISTLSHTLRHIQITHKKIASAALEWNELLQAIWQAENGGVPANYCIWLDESSVDNITNVRQSGWSDLGQAYVSQNTFIRSQCFSVLPALGPEGIIALDMFKESVNKDCFIQFNL